MNIQTRLFGEIEIDEEKIIVLEEGMIGFSDCTKFTLIFDEESGNKAILWMQAVENPELAFPMIEPLVISPDYNPVIEDELLKPLGEFTEEQLLILVVLRVPEEVTQMSANLKAPVVINGRTRKACQIIMEGSEYEMKYPIYDILNQKAEQEG